MAFCTNCGHALAEGAKFCFECGQKIDSAPTSQSERKVVFDGEVHKCPNCGDILDAYEAVCETCGYERRTAKTNSSIAEFVSQLNRAETREDKVCAIQNFSVPNAKEAIFEFMILASSNMNELSGSDVFEAWVAKFEQCYEKAKLSLFQESDLTKIQVIYDRTSVKVSSIKKKNHLKRLAAVVISILITIATTFFLLKNLPFPSNLKNNPPNNYDGSWDDTPTTTATTGYFEEGTYKHITLKNFSFQVPDYWEEEGSQKDHKIYYAERDEQTVMLSIEFPVDKEEDFDVSFEGLESDNENVIDSIESMFTDGQVFEDAVFISDYGVKGMLYHFTFEERVALFRKAEGRGYLFCFPSGSDRRWFYVVLLQTNKATGDHYEEDYFKILSSIKEK